MKNLILFVAALIILPGVASAEQISTPLVNLNLPSGQGFDGYINGLYIMSISLAALLAVIKIIIAGAKYAFTDVVSAKGNAKSDIQSALLGLLLIMGAVIVLELINPRLTSTAIKFKDIPDVPPASQNAPVQPTGGTTIGNTTISGNITTADLTNVPVNRRADYINEFQNTCQGINTYAKFSQTGTVNDKSPTVSCTTPTKTLVFDPASAIFDSAINKAPELITRSDRENAFKLACKGEVVGDGLFDSRSTACVNY